MQEQTIGERIRLRRKELKLTQKEISAAIKGVSNVAVSQWESDQTKPNAENAFELSSVLKCDIKWLLFGIGTTDAIPIEQLNLNKVPLISYVQAGMWTDVNLLNDTAGDFEYILTDLDVSEDAFALKIKGDSMEPDFIEGDTIIVDPKVKPHAGEFVVAKNGEYEATFKKYRPLQDYNEYGNQHFELVALNPDYDKLTTLKQDIRIVGTMVEHRIYRRKR